MALAMALARCFEGSRELLREQHVIDDVDHSVGLSDVGNGHRRRAAGQTAVATRRGVDGQIRQGDTRHPGDVGLPGDPPEPPHAGHP